MPRESAVAECPLSNSTCCAVLGRPYPVASQRLAAVDCALTWHRNGGQLGNTDGRDGASMFLARPWHVLMSLQNVRVDVPVLHSVGSLTRKLLGQRAVYEERQKRKGA